MKIENPLNSAQILIDSKKYILLYAAVQLKLEMEPKYLTKTDAEPIPDISRTKNKR